MKKDWQIKKLKDISIVFQDGDWVESKDQSTAGIRLIQTGNVGNAIFKDRSEKARYISEDTFKKLRCTEIFEGDCLVSRLPDPVGRVCLLPNTGEKMITVVDCTIIRLNHRDIIPNWFLYYSLSNEYNSEIQKQVSGATRQRISRKNLGLIPIPLPPLSEQKRIVAILDEAFEAIAKAKENTEQNLKNAKEIFESYLQGVFENKGDDWEEKKLGEVCDFQNGFAFQSKTYKESGLPILRITNIQNDRIDIKDLVYFDKRDYKINLDKFRIFKGDLLIAMSGGTTGKLGISDSESIFYLNQRVGKFIPKKDLNKKFLYYFLTTKVEESLKIAAGSAQPNLSTEQINNFVLPLPPLSEQKKIVQELDTLRAETQKLEAIYTQKLSDLEELQKSLLQKAFAGELVK